MRLLERTLSRVYIAPGRTETDALGGVRRVFSQERQSVRASMIPAEGALEKLEFGLIPQKRCLALMPRDARIDVGDGVAESAQGDPEWLCTDVQRWSAHVAAKLERRVAP